MWPQNPICTLALLLSVLPRAISIAQYTEYSWIEAFDRSHDGLDSGIESNALGGGAMPVPMSGNTKGWWARWLAVGGEGDVIVHLSAANLTLPHRPAAFPSHLAAPFNLPLSGQLVSFTSLPPTKFWPSTDGGASGALASDSQACIPATELRWTPPQPPYKIAFVERGGCDFATKVQAAQERGAAGVVVGDMIGHPGESEEEGRERESLITMFSPEDTDNIFIPSVFVSRASYLLLRDMLQRGNDSGRDEAGLWIELSHGEQEGNALSSLLSFALLMPSLFLCATIAIHRVRVARQRDADRAPPMVVLSLPERVWTPDIAWEKDDSSSDPDTTPTASPKAPTSGSRPPFHSMHSSLMSVPTSAPAGSLPPPPPISSAEVADPPASAAELTVPSSSQLRPAKKHKHRTKSQRYFSNDECAICMESFQRGEIVRILPCGHVFHKDECDEWLMKWRKLCPTCRADVTIPPGANVQGATITPIAPVDEQDEESSGRSMTTLVRGYWQSLRSVYSRRVSSPRERADETTPLVPHTPGNSDRAV